jgi:hypothetical protein
VEILRPPGLDGRGGARREEQMRIRDLKRKPGSGRVPAWPPEWTSADGAAGIFRTSDEGVLESVERFKERLIVRMRFDEREHLGSLQWNEPPTVDEVEAVLKAHLGESIRSVGDLMV